MIDKLIFDNTSLLLEKAASGASRRQDMIAGNLANVNTPGYIRRDISFKDQLASAIKNNGAESPAERVSIARTVAQTYMDNSMPLRLDGNNVDVDMEMASLAENQIEYNAYTRLLTDKISIMRSVIKGR